MSMLTEQVERMRRLADEMEKSTFVHEATHFIAIKVLREAAYTIETLSAKVRKENGFIFTENPTNGDMIKALFPNCVIDEDFGGAVITNIDNKQYWRKDWWNSPYKKGQNE